MEENKNFLVNRVGVSLLGLKVSSIYVLKFNALQVEGELDPIGV